MHRRPPRSTRTYTLFPDTTLFRSDILQILISDRDAVVRGVTKEDAFALIDEFSKRYDAESNLSFSAIFLSPDDSKAFGWYGGRNGEKIQNWTKIGRASCRERVCQYV